MTFFWRELLSKRDEVVLVVLNNKAKASSLKADQRDALFPHDVCCKVARVYSDSHFFGDFGHAQSRLPHLNELIKVCYAFFCHVFLPFCAVKIKFNHSYA